MKWEPSPYARMLNNSEHLLTCLLHILLNALYNYTLRNALAAEICAGPHNHLLQHCCP